MTMHKVTVAMSLANETTAAYVDEVTSYQDRQLFVSNLGVLLSQTREGIELCYLDENETVHVIHKNGYEQCVNINMDSYAAIIRDVMKVVG